MKRLVLLMLLRIHLEYTPTESIKISEIIMLMGEEGNTNSSVDLSQRQGGHAEEQLQRTPCRSCSSTVCSLQLYSL